MTPPSQEWPLPQRLIWAALALFVCVYQVPIFLNNLRPDNRPEQSRQSPAGQRAKIQPGKPLILDFFQEWASAKNYFTGRPVYTGQKKSAKDYLNETVTDAEMPVKVNAHPPTSVLLALPFAALSYSDAFLVWNLVTLLALAVSMGIVVRQLTISYTAWSVLPTVVLLAFCNPFWQHINQGQINLMVLPLLTGIWAADRSGRPVWAGVFLGLATALKLFPGFLFVYYLLRGQWKVIVVGVISLAAVTGLTVAVLGVQTYQSYIYDVLPQVQEFKDWWANISLIGFWNKLFNGLSGHVVPLWYSPLLANAGAFVSCALVIGVLAWKVGQARSQTQQDLAFALATTAMLLVSPIAWDHYFLFLLVPLALIWAHLPPSWVGRLAFTLLIIGMWINPVVIWDRTIPGLRELGGGKAYPIHALTVLSYQCLTLVGVFLFLLVVYNRVPAEPTAQTLLETAKGQGDLDSRLGLKSQPQAPASSAISSQ
jgi:hypothetical protein